MELEFSVGKKCYNQKYINKMQPVFAGLIDQTDMVALSSNAD